MSYATTEKRPNPLAAFGAMGVPAGFGAILVIGLAVNGTIKEEDGRITGIFVPVDPIEDPLPPPPTPTPETASPKTTTTPIERPSDVVIPDPNVTLSGGDPITVGTGINDSWGTGLDPLPVEIPTPRPTPMFPPVDASPRGNPANWVTTADYRSTWIRRELTGTARFTLQIDASGKVTNCTITGSTGHAQLDRATCRILQGRARFNPAKGSDGQAIAGSYSSAVNWTIPE